MQRLLVIVHVMAIAVFLGSTLYLALLMPVVGRNAPDAVSKRAGYADLFRVYSPLTIALLLVIVMTGAWSLTAYKAALGAGYFAEFGSAMAGKLALAFVVIIVATYACFGLCYRIVRADQGGLPVTQSSLRRMRVRLQATLWILLALTLWTAWLGVQAGRSVVLP